jgi:hypothetical protein
MSNYYLDFLEDIKYLPWGVRSDGKIRTTMDECPICAYVNQKLGTDYTFEVMSALAKFRRVPRSDIGVGDEDLAQFIFAADNEKFAQSDLRNEILTRLNLITNAE